MDLMNFVSIIIRVLLQENQSLGFTTRYGPNQPAQLHRLAHGFEPHRPHCVVVLEQDTFILV